MFILFLTFLLSRVVLAEPSLVVPEVRTALSFYKMREVSGVTVLSPEVLSVLKVLETRQLPSDYLDRIDMEEKSYLLPPRDKYDHWTKVNSSQQASVRLALHAMGIHVIDPSDQWLKDDLYAYFMITDGVIPVGKVTSIYQGVGADQGILFSDRDRILFPINGEMAREVSQHLIIDYAIVESDGDDIKTLHALSQVIVDLAVAVYSVKYPEVSVAWVNLRREVKALAEYLLQLDSDDRLVIHSFGYRSEDLEEKLRDRSYFEVINKHKKETWFESWEYKIGFRFLRK